MRSQLWRLALPLLLTGPAVAEAPKPAAKARTVELPSYTVGLSEPTLVARSPGFLWFPTLHRLADGGLLAVMSDYADMHVTRGTARVAWSRDGGRTWGPTRPAIYGDVGVPRPGGDLLLLPYYLYPRKDGMGAPCQVVPRGKQDVVDKGEVVFTGWPRPDRSFDKKLGLSGFVTNGQVVALKGGGWLSTLYGYFGDDKRYSLVAAESADGFQWKVRSVVAAHDCKISSGEGPCESALCRLKDGRLLCVFRLASNVPYGQCFSRDDGKTWTEPELMPRDVFSVQPSLAVLPDGAVALSGGRPGLYLWLNAAGDARSWERVDVLAHHNATVPTKETIAAPGNTSSYTEIVPLDDRSLLMIYDRIPHSWNAIPKGSKETNSVWVVRVTLQKKEKPMGSGNAALTPELRRRCLDTLRKALRNHAEDLIAAAHAAEALTQAGHGDEVRAGFGPILEQQTDGKKRVLVARELVRAGDRDKAALIVALVADADANVHAAESLYKVGEVGDGKLLRKAYEQTENLPLRMMAAAALARKGDAAARAFLREAVADPRTVLYAAWALGRIGDRSDAERIRRALQTEKRPAERAFAEQALACLGDAQGRAALAAHFKSADKDTRALAAEAAGVCRATEHAAALAALLDNDPVFDVRVRAAQGLLLMARE